ncbi:helix-turn-helix domain-containing protein [Lacinutrix cladophorae]
MKIIKINAENTMDSIQQIKEQIGGTITQKWGENVLDIDNEFAKGCIRSMSFDWGVSFVEFNLIFFQNTKVISDPSKFNPIQFSYSLNGSFDHKFSNQEEFTTIEQFHSFIGTCDSDVSHHFNFPKDVHIELNTIRIIRKKFLNKRINISNMLNNKLYEVFVDKQHDNKFAYYGPISLKMADRVKALQDIKTKGMIRLLKAEGELYQLLSMHIELHNKYDSAEVLDIPLSKSVLKRIKKLGKKIVKNPEDNYLLEELSSETGLSQAKLQEGFKFLFAKTVTEYIRHVRLEKARDLMNNTNLNISQIVYSIGFTSRSYFSKIFKDKYGLTPNEFKKQIVVLIEEES